MCMTSPVLLYDNGCNLLLHDNGAHPVCSPVLLDCHCSLQIKHDRHLASVYEALGQNRIATSMPVVML